VFVEEPGVEVGRLLAGRGVEGGTEPVEAFGVPLKSRCSRK
jgi:hypothetical protein